MTEEVERRPLLDEVDGQDVIDVGGVDGIDDDCGSGDCFELRLRGLSVLDVSGVELSSGSSFMHGVAVRDGVELAPSLFKVVLEDLSLLVNALGVEYGGGTICLRKLS